MEHPDMLPGGRNAQKSINNNNSNNKISHPKADEPLAQKRSNVMKYKQVVKNMSRGLFALLILALIATMAMGQNLVISGGLFTGSTGTINVKGNITNTAPVSVLGTVVLNGSGTQAIGTATNGAITFGTLTVNTPSATPATTAVDITVSTALSIDAAGKLDIQNNTLNIGGTSTRNGTGVLTAAGTSTVNFTSGSPQGVMPNAYATLGLSGAGAKTFPAGTTTVNTALTAAAASAITVTGTLNFAASANGNIAGDLANNGTFTAPTTGLITFDGAVQAISGSSSLAFTRLTIGGTDVKNADVNMSVAGQLTVNQNLNMNVTNSRVLTMLDAAKTTQPSYATLAEVTGTMQWQAYSAQSYTFNNALTAITFNGADGTRTFDLKVQPSVNPTSYVQANTVNRKINASFANWSTGTVDMKIAYQNGEADGTLTQGRLKEFHGAVTAPDKLGGTVTRLASGAGSLGWVMNAGLANTAFTTGDEIQLDSRFGGTFTSIAASAWNVSTTWSATDPSTPTSEDDIVINTAVSIPDGLVAAAKSTTINNAAGALTVGGGTNGSLAVGTGGLTNNNNTITGLSVSTGAAVTVTGANLTNAGKLATVGTGSITITTGDLVNSGTVTNAGTITVQ